MKHSKIFLPVLLVVLLSTSIFANKPSDDQSAVTRNSEENYLVGIQSDNFGLKISSIYFLGEYKCSEAVIPLLRILKSDTREEARIAAALALYKIDDARGNYAVKMAVKFDDSKRVKKICCLLYTEKIKPQTEAAEVLASK